VQQTPTAAPLFRGRGGEVGVDEGEFVEGGLEVFADFGGGDFGCFEVGSNTLPFLGVAALKWKC
jgi:hypothetical protein